MKEHISIQGRKIGAGKSVYIIAEMSNNHHQDFNEAVRIIRAANEAGADAIKLQTYTPETITIDCGKDLFRIKGTPWNGHTLYSLYKDAHMPWEWHAKLKELAQKLRMHLFSSPFDETAVDYLEFMGVPAYKIASFEIVDIPLLQRIAKTGKPVIMSTGMATLGEIEEAVQAIRMEGNQQIALLKCTSAYPSLPENANLKTIPHLARAFNLPVGLSDHTLGIAVPVASTAMGACIIEKHLTLSRNIEGPDSAFSLEPHEFKSMVEAVRMAEKALGTVHYGVGRQEESSRVFRRSLFVVENMTSGERFSAQNVRSIRPGYGLHTRHLNDISGKCARKDIKRGTPLSWDLVADPSET
jgi:pseudaminic acid synthase